MTDIESTAVSENERKAFSIIVNGQQKVIPSRNVTFHEVVKLAEESPSTDPNTIYTVTYRKAVAPYHEGIMVKGETVEIKDGTVFNVTSTSKS